MWVFVPLSFGIVLWSSSLKVVITCTCRVLRVIVIINVIVYVGYFIEWNGSYRKNQRAGTSYSLFINLWNSLLFCLYFFDILILCVNEMGANLQNLSLLGWEGVYTLIWHHALWHLITHIVCIYGKPHGGMKFPCFLTGNYKQIY